MSSKRTRTHKRRLDYALHHADTTAQPRVITYWQFGIDTLHIAYHEHLQETTDLPADPSIYEPRWHRVTIARQHSQRKPRVRLITKLAGEYARTVA
jgi:hypothetical protein